MAKAAGFSRTLWVLGALIAGIGIGAWLAASGSAALASVSAVADPVGGVWLDALRMTIVPLVFAMLFTGIASAAGTARGGGIAAWALALFVVLIVASAAFSLIVSPALFSLWPVPADAARALTASAGTPANTALPTIGAWLRSFVPVNPVASAAQTDMVPLVVFALTFGLAATRIPAAAAAQLTGFFDAVVQAMLVIVGWVIAAAPVGVFALSLLVGAKLGVGAFGLLVQYIALLVSVQVLLILTIYPLAVIGGGVRLGAFIRAVAPAQLVALSTQSSLASLPAMVEGGALLELPERFPRLVLPLAVSLFRFTSPTANLAVVVYVAALHGVHIGLAQALVGIAVAVAVSVASVGLPGQTSFFLAVGPICIAMGVPIDLLPLLLAVETIPDIFRTLGNVTADVAVAAVVARRSLDRSDE